MHLRLVLTTATFTAFAVGRALDAGLSALSISQMARRPGFERSLATKFQRGQKQAARKIKFKRDGSVQGFFDDDYASDADWDKFTKKGGALVRPPKRLSMLYSQVHH